MSAVTTARISLRDFLAWEQRQPLRYEFDGIRPVAMAGGTAAHDRIAVNLSAALVVRLRGKPCRPCGSNLKVEVMGRIRYPDGFVTCTPLIPDATVDAEPVVIFEVLSRDTDGTDRIEKNREYRATPSLTYYVMIESDTVAATVLERRGGEWTSLLAGRGDILTLRSIDVELPLLELYEGLSFPPEPTDG